MVPLPGRQLPWPSRLTVTSQPLLVRNRVTLTGPATMEVSCRQTTLGSRHPGDEIRTTGQALEASIYFFCSEALTNVVKHARASSAWVCVACEDNRCTIEVRDDGIGGAEAQ